MALVRKSGSPKYSGLSWFIIIFSILKCNFGLLPYFQIFHDIPMLVIFGYICDQGVFDSLLGHSGHPI